MAEKNAILPENPAQAVKHMTKLVEQLIDVTEREGIALARRDAVAFAGTQDEKKQLTIQYEQASSEFGQRLQEFRSVDKALIDRLESQQEALKAKALDSAAAMERMQG